MKPIGLCSQYRTLTYANICLSSLAKQGEMLSEEAERKFTVLQKCVGRHRRHRREMRRKGEIFEGKTWGLRNRTTVRGGTGQYRRLLMTSHQSTVLHYECVALQDKMKAAEGQPLAKSAVKLDEM